MDRLPGFHAGGEQEWRNSPDYYKKQQEIAKEVDDKYNKLIEGVTDKKERRKIQKAHTMELNRRLSELGAYNLY